MGIKYYLSKVIKKINIPSIKNSEISKKTKVLSQCNLVNVKIERYSYVGNNCTIINAEIGSFCSIADNCVIGASMHPIDWISTSPVFYKEKNILKKNFSNNSYNLNNKIIIGNDVWIGINTMIKPGITIGNGAIIGMGSVVTKSVGEYEIWAGNPAHIIRKRFKDEHIKTIKESKWWEKSELELELIGSTFNSIEEFKKINEKEI